jgi:hypothetical protein
MEAVFVFRLMYLHASVAGNPHVLYPIGWNVAHRTACLRLAGVLKIARFHFN